MSIPLGALQANDISIPISVYHHGGQPKVAEGEGQCGVGWFLSASGSIQREIRGLPDEINTADRKGWLYNLAANAGAVQSFFPSADDNLATNDDASDFAALEALHSDFSKDTEPDVFTVVAPGLSLQFVFDASGTPRPLTNSDVVIEVTGNLLSFTIRTNNGMVYTFGGTAQQTSSRDVVLYKSSGSATTTATINSAAKYIPTNFMYSNVGGAYNWKLMSMTSTVTGTSATFKYRNSAGDDADGASKEYYDLDSVNYVLSLYKFHQLEYIKLKSYKASFNWGGQILMGITIADTVSSDSRSVLFKYLSAYASPVVKNFLRELIVKGSACETGEMHQFEYINIPNGGGSVSSILDWKRNWKLDYYGFPNGSSTNKNKPTLYLLKAQTNEKRLRVISIPGTSPTVISGNDRSVGLAFTGALSKIVYPSGGYTQVNYGRNRFLDTSISPSIEYYGPGIRVAGLTSYAGELAYGQTMSSVHESRKIERVFEYFQEGDTISSGRITSPAKLGYIDRNSVRQVVNNLGDEPAVLYARVVERTPGKGYTVHEYNLPGMFPQTSSGLWKASWSRVARNLTSQADRDTSAQWLKHGYYTFPYAPSTNYEFKRGQPTRVATYSQSGSLLFEKTFAYTSISSNPQTVKGLRFEKLGTSSVGYVYYYGIYEILTGRSEFLTQEIVKQASLEDPTKLLQTTTNYGYNGYNLLATVTSIMPNNTTTTKTIKYSRDFPFTNPPSTDTMAVALKALNTSYRGNAIVQDYTTVSMPNESTTTIAANLVLYRDFGNGLFLPYSYLSLPPGATFAAATMSGQNFAPNSNYQWIRKVLAYEEGKAQVEMSQARVLQSAHFAKSNATPVAQIGNAAANECIYDGFENEYVFGLQRDPTNLGTGSGWTGEKAIIFSADNQKLFSVTPLVKNGTTYRISCWAFAPVGRHVIFTLKKSDGSTLQSASLAVTLGDQWAYLESTLTIGANDIPYSLEVKTDATQSLQVMVDDVVLIPSKARISLQSGLALKGVTSVTDDRGFSAKTTYDHLGRPVSTLDRNRDLVARNEYATKNASPPKVNAYFTVNPAQPSTGASTTFSPTLFGMMNCNTAITYFWEVDGVVQTTSGNGSMSYTFQTPGLHSVNFTATSSSGSYTHSQSFCVNHNQPNLTINHAVTNSQGQPSTLTIDCNSDNRTITLDLPSTQPGCVFDIIWTKDGAIYGYGSSITIYPVSVSANTNYTYIANVSLNCGGIRECALSDSEAYTGQKTFVVTNNYSAQCP